MLMKILGTIFGVLCVSGGIQSMVTPVSTVTGIAATVPVFIGILLVISGINRFAGWLEKKRGGEKDGFLLVESIVSFLAGAALLGSGLLQASLAVALIDLIPILMASTLILLGILRITNSVQMKRLNKLYSVGSLRLPWGAELALGIVLTVIGALTIVNPLSAVVGAGVMIGIDLVTAGISLITLSLVN